MEIGNSILRLCQVFPVLSICYIVAPATKNKMGGDAYDFMRFLTGVCF